MRNSILSRLRTPDGRINPWVIALTVTLATFMEVLDTSIANVALPHISGNLSAGADESTWVLTSYLVSNAIVLPLSGWLSSLIGRKRFYMSCVALFTVSSFLCGLAPSLGVLVFFRILQGVGGGGLQPSEQAILNDTFPLEKRGMAFAVYGLAVVVAPTVGPWLGGWITDNFSWRWIFYINVPVGIISLLLTSILVSDPPYMKKASLKRGFRIDYVGIGLISLGLGSMQIILDKGQREDWLSSNFIVCFVVLMLIGLVAGIFWELHEKEPVVDLRMLKNRNFAVATLAMFFLGFVLYASTVLIPQFLQELLGYTAKLAGMALSPGGAVIMCMMPVVGFLVSKVDTRILITFGCVISSLALFVMAGWDLKPRLRPCGSRPHDAELRPCVSVHPHQRLRVRVRAAGKDEHGHRHHQPGAQHRRQRGHRHGNHNAAAPRASASGAIDGTRQLSERGVPQHHRRHAGKAGRRGLHGGPGSRTSARSSAGQRTAPSRDAGIHRQFQNAGHRVFRGDSDSAAAEEAKVGRKQRAGSLRRIRMVKRQGQLERRD